MNDLIEKIKSNLAITVDVAIAVVAILVMAWVFLFSASGVRTEIKSVEKDLRTLSGLQKTSIVVPSVDPNQEDETLNDLTINETINQQMKDLAVSIDGELLKIRNFAEQRNRQDWLIEGLFPTYGPADLPHNASERYFNRLERLLGKPGPDQVGLDAGMPPTAEQIKAAVDRVKATAIGDKLGFGYTQDQVSKLTKIETDDIIKAMKQEHLDIIKQRAATIHIYAQTDPQASDYPFSRVAISSQPKLDELWEAQIQLWILTDLCRAISITNDTDVASRSVLQSPVKHLKQLAVLPGYVGLHVPGYVKLGTQARDAARSADNSNTTKLFDKPVGAGPEPAPGEIDPNQPQQAIASEQIRTPDNFFITPTGRTSNLLYDVRHARLRAVVNFQQLPRLLEAINNVNFMTVLSIDMTDVNEYEALENGYLYGPGDMVEVDMIIESIWLRSWTLEYMPDLVKISLGVIRVEGQKTDAKAYEKVWGSGGGDSWDQYYEEQNQ